MDTKVLSLSSKDMQGKIGGVKESVESRIVQQHRRECVTKGS